MAKRDFYDVLSVPRSASAEDIRRAHRRLARQLHPDVNKSPDAARQFAAVQEAYEVLSDDHKRAVYDRAGHAGLEADAAGAQPKPGPRRGPTYTWSNIGGARHADVPDLDELFDTFFAQDPDEPHEPHARPKKGRRSARARAHPFHAEIRVDFMTAALGGEQTIRLTHEGRSKTVAVTIPAGADDGSQLRVRGVFDADSDVLLTLRVDTHPVFRRGPHGSPPRGADVSVDVPITIAEATLGATILAPTLTGKVELVVPPGSPSGRMLRLRGLGVRPASGPPGDYYAVLRIVPPDPARLSEADRLNLREIASRSPNPRDAG